MCTNGKHLETALKYTEKRSMVCRLFLSLLTGSQYRLWEDVSLPFFLLPVDTAKSKSLFDDERIHARFALWIPKSENAFLIG